MADKFPLIIDNSEEKIKELVSGDNLDLTKSNLKNADYIQSAGVNVAGVATATSLIGDGSQLTNLPPSGGSLEATASGTLADGSTVLVNADGTVSVVAETETTGAGVESPTVFNSGNTSYSSATYDSTTNKVVVAYSDYGNSYRGTAVVGTVSGTSITFGSPVIFNSASAGSYHTSTVYDPSNNKVVIAYRDDGNSRRGTAIVGTVSGTSISFGSPTVFNSGGQTSYISGAYDSTNNKVVFAYTDTANNDYGTAVVGTVSGTSISFGSEAVFESATTYYSSTVYDSSNQKVVISYYDGQNGQYGTAVVGTVSGTSISFGTPVVFESAASSYFGSAYDSTNGKVVIAYRDNGNNGYGTAIVGTVSGTSISFGSAVAFVSSGVITPTVAYDSSNQKVVIAYRDSDNSSYGTLVTGTVSGTSISFGSPTIFESANSQYLASAYDSSNDKVVIAYTNAGNVTGSAVVFGNTGFSIPSTGSSVDYNSSQTDYNSAVFDSTNNKVVIAYRDAGNSQYGTAIVGTVSGTSISFGTPVVFESARSDYTRATFDSTNNKVVVAYSDNGNSGYGTAIVGTVSGTSISFGSPAIFNSGNTYYISPTFDSASGKVVIAYSDYTNSYYGKAVVGTVSGTSISFGSEFTFLSNNTYDISAVYDTANQKVVIAFRDYSNTASNRYGKAIVATVSGSNISFGSPVTFESNDPAQIAAAYDSSKQKVVIAYTHNGNSYSGTVVVGTVSGTSISFGTPFAFETGCNEFSIAYDSTSQKVVIVHTDGGNSEYGSLIVGTVSSSSNSISLGTPIVIESSYIQYTTAAYDSTNDRVVIAYRKFGSPFPGKAIVFSQRTISTNLTAENYIGISDGAYSNGQTATIQIMGAVDDAQSSLTPGQSYYVQNDGTLSTSADNPSVFAGTSIAATKLIVRG